MHVLLLLLLCGFDVLTLSLAAFDLFSGIFENVVGSWGLVAFVL